MSPSPTLFYFSAPGIRDVLYAKRVGKIQCLGFLFLNQMLKDMISRMKELPYLSLSSGLLLWSFWAMGRQNNQHCSPPGEPGSRERTGPGMIYLPPRAHPQGPTSYNWPHLPQFHHLPKGYSKSQSISGLKHQLGQRTRGLINHLCATQKASSETSFPNLLGSSSSNQVNSLY